MKNNRRRERFTILLSKDELASLKRFAVEMGLTVSDVIRLAVATFRENAANLKPNKERTT